MGPQLQGLQHRSARVGSDGALPSICHGHSRVVRQVLFELFQFHQAAWSGRFARGCNGCGRSRDPHQRFGPKRTPVDGVRFDRPSG
jgi:hypothetical protein